MNEKRVDKTENKENAKWKDKLIEKLKQFIKSRWFPLAVAGVILLVIVVAGFFFGFRITYAPELENSWEAISAVASWVGVVVSAVAVWAAVQIPEKIAKQQEKVELYTKRLEFYDILDACIRFSHVSERLSDPIKINGNFVYIFSYGEFRPNEMIEEINKYAKPLYKQVALSLRAGEFLFDSEAKEYIRDIIDTLPKFLSAKNESEIRDSFQKYKEAVNKAQQNLVPLVRDTLRLWSDK